MIDKIANLALETIRSGFARVAKAADTINESGGTDVGAILELGSGKREGAIGRRLAQVSSEMGDEVLRILDRKA